MSVFASEKQRDTPHTRKGDYGVDNTAEQRACTAENPSYKVKTEKTYKTPVKTAYDCKNKTNFIKHLISPL